MNRGELRAEVRRFLDDTEAPYEISDAALNARLDEAEREACVRARLLRDSSNATICDIAVVAGTATYPIDSKILDVLRVDAASGGKPLMKLGYKALDDKAEHWDTQTGTPSAYILNMDNNSITLFPTPEVNDTLTMTVNRLPLADMASDSAEPEIPLTYHYDLVYWVLHLTYLTRDSEIFNPQASAQHEAIFERRFGPRNTAKYTEQNKRGYRRRARAQWL